VGVWIRRRNGKKLKAAKKAKITRRVPQVGCTLCWAHGTPTNLLEHENHIHHEIFYPQLSLSQPAKKIMTDQHIYEADSRPIEKTTLRRNKTEPKNLDEVLQTTSRKKPGLTCQPYKTQIRPAERKIDNIIQNQCQ
jgi:hypothetical protein